MMYRIVYTKLSYSLLSVGGIIVEVVLIGVHFLCCLIESHSQAFLSLVTRAEWEPGNEDQSRVVGFYQTCSLQT